MKLAVFALAFFVFLSCGANAQKIDSLKILYESHEKLKDKIQETNTYIAEVKAIVQSYKDMHNWFMTSVGAVTALFTLLLIYNQIDIRSRLAGFEKEKKEALHQASNELKQKAEEELQKITQMSEKATTVLSSIIAIQNSIYSINPNPQDYERTTDEG